jgi:acetyl esterase/lipase
VTTQQIVGPRSASPWSTSKTTPSPAGRTARSPYASSSPPAPLARFRSSSMCTAPDGSSAARKLTTCSCTATWIVEHGAQHNLDPSRHAIAGDSVGGNMTIAVTLMAKQRGGPAFAAQLLYYPVTDARMDTDSYHEFAEGYFLTAPGMEWFWDQYLPDKSRREEILASPLRASTNELTGLPPALVVNGEADVLRDEGEAYATKLRAAGVPVTATRYGGIIHDFVMLHPLAETNAARAATTQGATFLHDALHGAPMSHANGSSQH